MNALAGLARTASRAVGGLALDASSGLARAAEAAKAAVTGDTIGPATLRVAVVILSDHDGPLTSAAAIAPSIDTAGTVLSQESGIRVRLTGIQVIEEVAPARALDPRANKRLLLDDVLGRTEFYRRHSAPVDLASAVVGAPITVVVVRNIDGRVTGCSLGISADWVIVQASLFDKTQPHTYDETVLVHELGHALNLPHVRDRQNLMFPASSPPGELRGTTLAGWQTAILQANRHVVPGIAR
ncbi:MAG: matrixin family metalloprotease [Nakamurella sp.]